jgi:hypothetical protein
MSIAKCLWRAFVVVITSGAMLTPPIAYSWDGTVYGTISLIDVNSGPLGYRVYLTGLPTMCTGGQNWAYLSDTDRNYKAYVSALTLAKALGGSVSIYSTLEGGYCHIGYITIN